VNRRRNNAISPQAGRGAPARRYALAALAAFLLQFPTTAHAQIASQNFESWPGTGNTWGNYTHDGWLLQDGQVRATDGGHAPALDTQCAWLNDFEASSNTWLMAPYMPYGADTITFHARRALANTADSLIEIQTSPDSTNWTTVQIFDRLSDDWSLFSYAINSIDPLYVRIAKTEDYGDEQYLGLDNITITPTPGVLLSGLAHDPPAPSTLTPVHIRVTAQTAATTSNVTLQAWYRFGTSGVFSAIAMTNSAGTSHVTQTPIAAGYKGIVQYFVRCDYTGIGVSPLFLPASASNNPAYFDTSNPYLNTVLRQLEPSSHRTPLILSEIMYNPREGLSTNSLSYIELFNTEPVDQDIGGYRLGGDPSFTFPLGTILKARSFAIVAGDPQAITSQYAELDGVYGPMGGSLPNGGGSVILYNREGALLLETTYDDGPPWPAAADGAGHSLVLARPDFGEGAPTAWQASYYRDGSPGAADDFTPTSLDNIVINEILAHTDLPLYDYVELFNTGNTPVNIGGCILTDNPDLNKFVIPPATILGPRQWIVFDQPTLGFSLRSTGDDVFLRAPDQSRLLDALRFPAQINAVSIGRYPDGTPSFLTLGARSPGASNTNALPRREGVIINEIMFHPISGLDEDEYIELLNTNATPVSLSGWRIDGGARFAFPDSAFIPATGYVVVAASLTNLLARYPALHALNTFGNLDGRLSDAGERIALVRPDDPLLPTQDLVVVDEVTYADDARWGEWTDGEGSSLELRDPNSDNSLPMNWHGSDESAKAPWTVVDVTGPMDQGAVACTNLRAMLLQPGECLVDDIQVLSAAGTTYLQEDFESGLSDWQILGNHSRSTLKTTEGFGSSQSLHVRASGAGTEGTWTGGWTESFLNHLSKPLSAELPPTGDVTIRAKMRWLAGWPHATLTLQGYWMYANVRLTLPPNLGTPGQRNSRYLANAGPAIDDLTHAPVLPATGQTVTVSARLNDPNGIASATLRYRLDPDTNVVAVTMNDSGTAPDSTPGDGLYSAAIPGQPLDTIAAFHVLAVDGAGATNRFPQSAPVGAPTLEALVRFGDTTPPGVLGSYRLWISSTNLSRWAEVPAGKYSNEPIDLTFVGGPGRVIYNATGRFRGLWRSYDSPVSSGAYAVELPRASRFQGDNEVKLDQIGQTGSDNTKQGEGYCFWAARRIGVPAPQYRYVRLFVNGRDRGILHDLQTPALDFCTSWYADEDPVEYKNSGWVGDPLAPILDGRGQYKQSVYRWLMPKRRPSIPDDDYEPLYDLIGAAATSNDSAYVARVQALVDRRQWSAFFAVCGATAAWDHYGWSFPHNSYIYTPHTRTGTIFLYDMDHSLTDMDYGLFPDDHAPILVRMFDLPAFRRPYWSVLKEMAEGPMAATEVNARMNPWYGAFAASGTIVSEPTTFKAWISTRRNAILAQAAPFATAFTVAGPTNLVLTNALVTLTGTAPPPVDTIRINGIPNRWTFSSMTNWSLRVGLPTGTNALTLTGHDWRGSMLASNTLTAIISDSPPSLAEKVIITEIMYHSPHLAGDYVELLNRSTRELDLRGWRLNGADITFEGGSILATGQFAIVAENLTAYQRLYSNAEVVVASFAGSLDNGGETLRLEAPVNGNTNVWTTIDTVTYDDDLPWPTEADGLGQSLQLIDINEDNNRPGNWATVDLTPALAWHFRSVTGTATNTVHPNNLRNARLQFFLHNVGTVLVDRVSLVTGTVAEAGIPQLQNGDFESAMGGTWFAQGNHSASTITNAGAYSGSAALALRATAGGNAATNFVFQPRPLTNLTAFPLTLSYWYFDNLAVTGITVYLQHSSIGLTHTASPIPTTPRYTPGAPGSLSADLPPLPALRINELMPSNVTAWADNFSQFDPWIEILNTGTTSVDLATCRLSNQLAMPNLWAFPTGTVLAAGARLLVWADSQTNQSAPGIPHANFSLHPITGSVVLSLAHLGDTIALDAITYTGIAPDFSYGSYPEGDPTARQVFHNPTPGSPNVPTSLPTGVIINEWMASNASFLQDPTSASENNGGFDDWFELFNPSPIPINLGGYFLTDRLDNLTQSPIPAGTVIPGYGFLLVWADEDNATGPGSDIHADFKLGASGETIAIVRPDGSIMDMVTFSAQIANQADGSWPDGSINLFPMSPPTPRSANRVLLVSSTDGSAATGLAVSWLGQSGRVYRVDAITNLAILTWQPIATVTAQSTTITYLDTNAPAFPRRFYRIVGTSP
jgi:hypothetical protein